MPQSGETDYFGRIAPITQSNDTHAESAMSTIRNDPHEISTLAQLEAIYPPVGLAAARKEIDYLHPVYQAMVAASPFVILATNGATGLDCSPRGDPAGFVRIRDAHTLWLPDRAGNNRIDSLRNLLHDPRIGLLFLIPGRGETLRVNGRARLTQDPDILADCAIAGKNPRCVAVITVETAFFQCGRAPLRAGLWDTPDAEILGRVPSAGTILESLTDSAIAGESYDAGLETRQKNSLY